MCICVNVTAILGSICKSNRKTSWTPIIINLWLCIVHDIQTIVLKYHTFVLPGNYQNWSVSIEDDDKNTGPIDSDTSLIDKDQLREIE